MSTYTTTSPRLLPVGWLRASIGGVEAVVMTWLAVAAVSLIAYTSTATAPQLGNATWTSALQIATGAFFLAFAQPIDTAIGPISLAPTLLTFLVGLLSYTASRRLDCAGLRHLWCTGAGASTAAVLIGAIAGTGLASLPAAVAAGIVAALGNLAALPRAERALTSEEWSGAFRRVRLLLERLPLWLRRAVPDALQGIWWLSLLGLVAVVAAIAAAWHRVSFATSGLADSALDHVAIWLAQLGYLPNAITWALGWLMGAGYSVGAVRFVPGADATGLLPAVPILGAGPHSEWSVAIALVPAAAVLTLAIWHTRRRGEDSLLHALFRATTVAVLLVGACVLAATLTSGAIGEGLLSRNGVWPLHMLAFSALTVALPYLLGVAGSHPDTITWVREKMTSRSPRRDSGDDSSRSASAIPLSELRFDEDDEDSVPEFLREDEGDYPPKS